MSANLYDLSMELRELQDMMEDPDIADEDIVIDTAEGSEGEYNDKMQSYCFVIRNLEGAAKVFAEEAKRMQEKSDVINRRIKYLKKRMLESLAFTGRTEAGGDILKVKVQKNGGKAPLILSDGLVANEIPERFQKISVDFDNAAIRDALENGEDLEFASIGERGTHIVIK